MAYKKQVNAQTRKTEHTNAELHTKITDWGNSFTVDFGNGFAQGHTSGSYEDALRMAEKFSNDYLGTDEYKAYQSSKIAKPNKMRKVTQRKLMREYKRGTDFASILKEYNKRIDGWQLIPFGDMKNALTEKQYDDLWGFVPALYFENSYGVNCSDIINFECGISLVVKPYKGELRLFFK